MVAAITFLGKKAFTPKCKPSIYHAVSLPKLCMLRFPHVGKINAYLPLTHLIVFLFMYTTTLSFTDMNCGLSRRQALGFPGGPVVRFCTSNAGDAGSILVGDLGSLMPCGEARKKRVCAVPGTSDSVVGKVSRPPPLWGLHPSGEHG